MAGLSKQQLITITAFAGLFLILLFGFSTKPKKLVLEEKERALNLQATDVTILQREAFSKLEGADRSRVQILESRLESETDSTAKKQSMIELSRLWYELGQFSIAGHYAEMIAEQVNSAEAWGIAGTTYAIGINQSQLEKEQQFCRSKSLGALENAISIDPDNLSHQINRAVVFAEHPDQQNPMKGILILLDLNKKFPKNVPVMNNLAKFALQTGQTDKAAERLSTALELNPNNRMSNCLMVQLLERTGQTQNMTTFRKKCEE